jgi:hypothetical protein
LNPDDGNPQNDEKGADKAVVDEKAALASTKAQFEAMKSEAARIKAIGMRVQMQDQGLVITTHTEMK